MGKAFLAKSNGGGGGLNFRVLGGSSAPSSPKPNDIWVNTSAEITSYIFSSVEPDGYAEGMVWISTGTTSPVEFSAIKKNSLMIYPISARQNISGEWVEKTTQSYQGGTWVDWWVPGTLYDSGRDDTSTTGGWISYSYRVDTGYTGMASSVTMEDASMVATMTAGGSSYRSSFVSTVNTIDLTDYSTAHFEFLNASGSGWAVIAVFDSSGTKLKSSDQIWSASGSVVESIDLDISDISGAARVGLMLWANSSSAVVAVEMAKAQLL